MSTIVKAPCPLCGTVVKMDAAAVRLHICPTEPDRSFYAFTCSGCDQVVSKPADPQTVTLLTDGGIRPVVWDGPSPRPTGPALTEEDLLAFGLAIEALPAAPTR